MSRAKRQSFDVFLSHDPLDNALAGAVIERLQAVGLSVFSLHLSEPKPLDPLAEIVRRELRDSFTFVVLLTPTFIKSEYLFFQVGAASVHGSPIYVLRSGIPPETPVPFLFAQQSGELWGDWPRIVEQIRQRSRPLQQEEYDTLTRAYLETGIPTDKLLTAPVDRSEFLDRFRKLSRRNLPDEKVLRELIRLRKAGRLPRLPVTTSK